MGEGQASLTPFSSRTSTSAGTQHLHLDFLLLDAPVSTVLKSKFSFLLFICFSHLVPARRSPIGAGTVAGWWGGGDRVGLYFFHLQKGRHRTNRITHREEGLATKPESDP